MSTPPPPTGVHIQLCVAVSTAFVLESTLLSPLPLFLNNGGVSFLQLFGIMKLAIS